MSRLSAALQAAVEKQVIQCYESVYLDIDGGIYITNAPMNITIDGNEYISLGQFLGFSSIEEQRLFTTSEITVTLAGIPAFETGDSFVSQILQFDYVDKDIWIYRSFFDHDTYIDSFLMFKGRIDSPVIEDDPGETTTVATTCSSHWVDYERTNGVITNDNRQQALYSGDLGFEYANQVIKDIQWKE
jgi:hypothetical protein